MPLIWALGPLVHKPRDSSCEVEGLAYRNPSAATVDNTRADESMVKAQPMSGTQSPSPLLGLVFAGASMAGAAIGLSINYKDILEAWAQGPPLLVYIV